MKRFLGLLLLALSIGSLGSLLKPLSASAVSIYDNAITSVNELKTVDNYVPENDPNIVTDTTIIDDLIRDNLLDNKYWNNISTEDRNEFVQAFNQAKNNGFVAYLHDDNYDKPHIRVVYSPDTKNLYFESETLLVADGTSESPIYSIGIYQYGNYSGATDFEPLRDIALSPQKRVNYYETISADTSLSTYRSIYSVSGYSIDYPTGYEGILLEDLEPVSPSSWTPDIKLHKGSNWEVELSDYNFFTFDNVAFTCGEYELAPVINWEVWDITDDENRVLIDTLIFGAPALVTYTAPKIPADKKYEIVAYYSDCEGMNFTQSSTRQFTIKKDGNLKSTDLASVCIMEEFPYVNIPNCLGDINDMFVTLTFRTPKADEISGGGWTNLVNGCRQLQVIDDWIMKPDIVICPQMPEQVRSIITPIVTFALALGVITFVANRQGIRGLG